MKKLKKGPAEEKGKKPKETRKTSPPLSTPSRLGTYLVQLLLALITFLHPTDSDITLTAATREATNQLSLRRKVVAEFPGVGQAVLGSCCNKDRYFCI